MFPVGSHSLQGAVVGTETLVETLEGRERERGLSLHVVDPEVVEAGALSDGTADCLVVETSESDEESETVVERWQDGWPNVPVVLLVAGWADERVADAVSAGAADVLPRRLVDTDPDVVVERIVEVVEREHALTSFRELYDEGSEATTVHDAETGHMVHANRTFCELLGYDRETIRTMRFGELIAHVPGYDHERAMDVFSSVAERDESLEIQWPLKTADGEVRWVDARLSSVRVGNREVVLSTSVDITERRRHEHRYEQVFDNVNDVISIHDPWAEEMLDVNETMSELTGYGHETLLEMDVGGVSDTDRGFSEGRAYEMQQRVAASGESETVEWMIETASGDRRLLETNLAPATIDGEDRVLALSRDVTERREYERRLERERDRRSVLFQNNPDPVIRVRFEGGEPIIREVNPAFEEVFGFPSADIVGTSVADAVVPADEREQHERLREKVVRGEPVEREARRLTADGVRNFQFKVIHFGSSSEDDSATDAYVWYTDVTDRKRREKTVRRLHESTDEVQNAETRQEVCEAVVDAAENVLGLANPACWVEGKSEESLISVAGYGDQWAGASSDNNASTFEPGDEGYAAYTENEPRVVDTTEGDEGDQSKAAILLPLGDHGLFGAAEPGGGEFEAVTRTAARILARHATTALERVERGRELRESDRRFRLIADRIDEVIFLSEPDFSELFYVNDAYETLWGESVEKLYDDPRGFIDSIDPRDRESFEADFEEMVADIERGDADESYVFEYRIRPDGGDVRWVRATGYPVELEDGDDTRFVGIVEDVTDRRELERTYRGVFENVSDGLVIHEPESGRIVDVNERFCRMNGYERDELVGETIDVVTASDHEYERAEALIQEAREQGSQLFEWRNRRKNGETYPVEVHLSVVDIRGNERVLGSVRDVTERKRREREYEQIFNGVQDAITVFDPSTGEIVEVNDTYREMLGYDDLGTIRELGISGLSVSDEGYTEERGTKLIREVAETGEPRTVEWRGERKDGESLWLEAKLAPVEIGGDRRVVSMQRNVTERKRREHEYEQIFDGVHDAITVHDSDTAELVDVNETFCDLLGYERAEILEMGVDGYTPEQEGYSLESGREFIHEVVETGDPKQITWPVETRDGELRWLDIEGTTVEIGGRVRYVSIGRDVTERRRTERKLSAILDRIDEAIFLTRVEEITAASQSPDYVSSGYESIWGQSLEQIRDSNEDGFFGTLHPDDEEEYRSTVEAIVADVDADAADDRYSQEYRIERTDGAIRWVQSDYYPTEWGAGETRIVIVSRDVTARKARERRIASFDDATDDLARADSPEEAARQAVEAATDLLELPAVGVLLYDDDDGVLRPEVLSGQFPEAVATDSVGPSDGALWEVFATGTIVASDGGTSRSGFVGATDARPDTLSDLEAWRAMALGNHGVLLVGAPEQSLDSDTIQAAHVLAATLEAAFSHLQSRERLAAQEERLRTQTERADRLDRIAHLAQQVEAAITDASAPAEVEQEICDRLAGSGPYDLAWTGGIDVGTDRLAARTVVGATDQYVDEMALTTTDSTADPHPAVTTWRTDEVCVADSIVDDGPTGDWRRIVLSEGYQSLCAVPLTYDGITHGVLTIGRDTPNAFDERERAMLSQLGTSIGYALAAIERRRALESDESVELEFRGSNVALPFARAAAAADCRVTLVRTVARQDGPTSVYVRFEGDLPDNTARVADRAFSGDVSVVSEASSKTVFEVRADEWFGSPLAEYGGVIRDASADADETTLTVEVPGEADVRSFVGRLQEMAPSLELVARRQHRRRDRTPAELSDRVRAELTDRQFEVVQTALSAGYFEWPRENDGGEVADRLGITQPTLNKHLRLAEKKTFGLLFDTESE